MDVVGYEGVCHINNTRRAAIAINKAQVVGAYVGQQPIANSVRAGMFEAVNRLVTVADYADFRHS